VQTADCEDSKMALLNSNNGITVLYPLPYPSPENDIYICQQCPELLFLTSACDDRSRSEHNIITYLVLPLHCIPMTQVKQCFQGTGVDGNWAPIVAVRRMARSKPCNVKEIEHRRITNHHSRIHPKKNCPRL
jgi:hypothetical protein